MSGRGPSDLSQVNPVKYNESKDVSDFMRSFDSGFSSSSFEDVNPKSIPLPLKKIFSANTPFSLLVNNVYHQSPEINIIEEQAKDGLYIRKQTTEVLTDNFCFSPVIFSYISIDQSNPTLINPGELTPIENALRKHGKNATWTFKQVIKAKDWKEPVKFLGSNIYGKLDSLSVDGKTIAEVLEFISLEPYKKAGTTIYDEINQLLLNPSNPKRNLENVLQHIKGALEIAPSVVLDTYFPNLSNQIKKQVEEMVDGVEHIAILAPSNTNKEDLDKIATEVGFTENHLFTPSVIVSKELGALLGKKELPTLIFKAWGQNSEHKKIGLEVFIPQEKTSKETEWIAHGITTHISLRVKSLKDITTIHELISEAHIEMAKFMNGKLILENEVYYDVFLHGEKMRIEFNFPR